MTKRTKAKSKRKRTEAERGAAAAAAEQVDMAAGAASLASDGAAASGPAVPGSSTKDISLIAAELKRARRDECDANVRAKAAKMASRAAKAAKTADRMAARAGKRLERVEGKKAAGARAYSATLASKAEGKARSAAKLAIKAEKKLGKLSKGQADKRVRDASAGSAGVAEFAAEHERQRPGKKQRQADREQQQKLVQITLGSTVQAPSSVRDGCAACSLVTSWAVRACASASQSGMILPRWRHALCITDPRSPQHAVQARDNHV